jgi:hypothetical protein
MATMKWKTDEARDRIDAVRHRLIDMKFQCLSSGAFGLPSYDQIQCWAKANRVVYLLFDMDGGWNVLSQICDDNDVEKTFEALAKLS